MFLWENSFFLGVCVCVCCAIKVVSTAVIAINKMQMTAVKIAFCIIIKKIDPLLSVKKKTSAAVVSHSSERQQLHPCYKCLLGSKVWLWGVSSFIHCGSVRLGSALSLPPSASMCRLCKHTGPAGFGSCADCLLLWDLNYGGKNSAVRARRQLVLGWHASRDLIGSPIPLCSRPFIIASNGRLQKRNTHSPVYVSLHRVETT